MPPREGDRTLEDAPRRQRRVPLVEPLADGGALAVDEALSALAHPTRRCVLYYLKDEEVADLEELGAVVAAMKSGTPPDDVPADERDRMAAELAHTHLPKLDEALFVEYDRRSQTVRYADPPAMHNMFLLLLSQFEGKDAW